MYKLLVADDEQKDRNIIRILVEKQYPNTFEILEAKSGTQALEILRKEKIDLLLLDMNMPGLSGVGVIRELNKPTYVIIITAYSFFDYAREALHYGVKDYILKPPIRSELYAAIDRFFQEHRGPSSTPSLSQKALAQELATQMLFYGNPQKIETYQQVLGFQNCRVSLVVLLNDNQAPRTPEQSLSVAEEFLDNYPLRHATVSFREGIAVLFFWNTESEQEQLHQILPQLQNTTGGHLEVQHSISSPAEIPQHFIQICDRNALNRRTVSANDQSGAIEQAIRSQNFNEAMRFITEQTNWWDYQAQSDAIKFHLVLTLSSCTKHLFANADKRGAYAKLSVLLGAETQEELLNSTAEYLHWLIGEIRQSVYTNSYVVHRVIDAVNLDCSRSWTIDGLASELNISSYYLSHLFKEYTGSTFTDYLTEYRIERAIELMKNSSLTLAQIGEMVGYSDQNYFSRVFKKRRGIGARQYRKQLLSE